MADSSTATARPSCGAVERAVREVWAGYFDRPVAPDDDFFDLGGDSLAMIEVVRRARERGLAVRASVALRNPSPARLAEALTVRAADAVDVPALLPADDDPKWTVTGPELLVAGDGAPLCVVHSDSHVEAERAAVTGWDVPGPVIAIALPTGLPRSATVREIADRLAAGLGERPAPRGFVGFGFGAVVALELAGGLPLIAVRPPALGPGPGGDRLAERVSSLARRFGLTGSEDLAEIHTRMRADGWYDDGVQPADLPRRQRLWARLDEATRAAAPRHHDGPLALVHDVADDPAVPRTWSAAAPQLAAHPFDHGIDSPMAVLRDPRLAAVTRKALGS